ncbi:GGDEF domain-containing protein [uncultured Sphingomonas sp.]|uniref:GGDEF domain-containing protein n=1 Tax=uncultured Sphingomonas sp. TaxID=158754 RepID=UPI0035CB1824
MRGAAARNGRGDDAGDDLFARVGAFLLEHRLSPDPAHYLFAYHVLSDPAGALAAAVARITDDGVRLSRADIEKLGGTVVGGTAGKVGAEADEAAAATRRLMGEVWSQVEEFARVMRDVHHEAQGFGRDLAAHAATMDRATTDGTDPGGGMAELARITGAVLARVHAAEERLERATREGDELRAKLAEAQVTARVDMLTGLPNRRAFEEAFAARRGSACLAICDVDRFKRINDGYGHGVGDRVLSAIADSLRVECGEHMVARHGGEEFAVLLTGVDPDRAAAILEGAREAVATKRFRSRENDMLIGRVTVSVGLTSVNPGEPLVEAFARADRFLYTAKTTGRDRLCMG